MRKVRKYFVGFFLLLLLVMEWGFEVVLKLWTVLHTSVKDLAMALQTIYNELNDKPGEPDS